MFCGEMLGANPPGPGPDGGPGGGPLAARSFLFFFHFYRLASDYSIVGQYHAGPYQ